MNINRKAFTKNITTVGALTTVVPHISSATTPQKQFKDFSLSKKIFPVDKECEVSINFPSNKKDFLFDEYFPEHEKSVKREGKILKVITKGDKNEGLQKKLRKSLKFQKITNRRCLHKK